MATTYTDCITFTGETSDFTLKASYKEWDGTVEYSTDHNTWKVWNGGKISSVDKKLYLRGSGNTKFFTSKGARFVLSARAACSGNIQTLLEYSNPPSGIPASNCYKLMFYGCSTLTKAPELPAATLATACYREMFYDCTSLTTAPELPATTLADYCYTFMFLGCTNLTTVPTLPATTLAGYCYYSIFGGCTSLTQAPALPATTLAVSCYREMFKNCTSLKISATQSSKYPTAWRIPSSGTISSTPTTWNTDMLKNTGGTFKSDPSINTTYYGAWSLVETYNINYNLTNCTGASTNPTTIDEGTTATLSFTANEGYSFPDKITVTGVESYTWDKSTGTLTLTNATGDVSIAINCIVAYPKINSFTYYGKQINNINGKPIRYVHDNRAGANKTYEMVYVMQLATPQNVTANGTTVSWDEVENATSYAVLADGVSIGEYTLQPEPTTISIKIAYQNSFGPSYNTYKVNDGVKTDITYEIGRGSSTSFTLEQLQAITTEITGINKLEVYGTASLTVEVRIYNSNGVLTHNFNNGEAHEKYFDITQYIENGGYVVIYGDD